MGIIWWILPAIVGVLGLMLLLAGLGRLARKKPIAGGTRSILGIGFLGLAGVLALTALNMQTFSRLTYERDVANIKFTAVDGEPGAFLADVKFANGGKLLQADGTMPIFRGDEFQIGAQVIKFKPFAVTLGYDSIYRLDHIEARQSNRYSKDAVTEAQSNGMDLTDNPGIDVHDAAKRFGKGFGFDAQYGSATYQPMSDGFEYNVSITQDALIARPTKATDAKIRSGDFPGFR